MNGHRPRKRFGQHFLADRSYVERIVSALQLREDDNVVEIGPGLGALTTPLLARLAHLHVVEIDRDLAARLRQSHPPERLSVHEADALDFDYRTLGSGLRIIGNLPYNISTPLLFRFAEHADGLRDITVMLQKEVVDRMVAEPATPDYGRLSVMLQAQFRLDRLFGVPPGAFRPPPQVDSAVVRLVPLAAEERLVRQPESFARVVAAAFGQRRKTLRNALRPFMQESDWNAVGIDSGRRGEELSVADFVRIAEHAGRAGG